MNCKPGDLAYILKTAEVTLRDKIVRVGELNAPDGSRCQLCGHVDNYWTHEPIEISDGGWPRTVISTCDCRLRPIRDPGEEAQDETLAWKPVPLPTLIPA